MAALDTCEETALSHEAPQIGVFFGEGLQKARCDFGPLALGKVGDDAEGEVIVVVGGDLGSFGRAQLPSVPEQFCSRLQKAHFNLQVEHFVEFAQGRGGVVAAVVVVVDEPEDGGQKDLLPGVGIGGGLCADGVDAVRLDSTGYSRFHAQIVSCECVPCAVCAAADAPIVAQKLRESINDAIDGPGHRIGPVCGGGCGGVADADAAAVHGVGQAVDVSGHGRG